MKNIIKNRRKAFSLVELMIVILIVAVLAIAVFAGGSAAIMNSRVDRTLSDLHHFDIAAKSTLNESGYVASIENNDVANGTLMRDYIEAFNEMLPNEYRLKDTETPLTSSSESGISVLADTAGKYVVYESQKSDAWNNPYYIIFDCGNRSAGSADFFVTAISAGPNGKTEIGGNIESDDIFLIAESRNHIVNTETINCRETGEFIVAGSKWNLVATRLGDTTVGETEKAKYTSSGSGTTQMISATTPKTSTTPWSQVVENHLSANPVAYAYVDTAAKTLYFDRVKTDGDVPSGAFTGFEEASYTSSADVPWSAAAKAAGITKIVFQDVVQPVSTRYWFSSDDDAYASVTSVENGTYLDTGKVTNMQAMFYNCVNLESVNVSNWDTSKVTDMGSMFCGCGALEALDTAKWDTSHVNTMYSMFCNCASLTSLNLSGWDTNGVTNMKYMFSGDTNLSEIIASASFSTQNVTTANSESMFTGCTALVGGKGTTFDNTKTDKSYARMDTYGIYDKIRIMGEKGYFTAYGPSNSRYEYGFYVSPEESLDIYYVVKLGEGENSSDYSVRYNYIGAASGGDVSVNEWRETNLANIESNGQTYKLLVASPVLKQMTDSVDVQLKRNGTVIVEESFCVRNYCDYMIENSNNALYVTLCQSMLDYGAATQNSLSYKTGDLANKNHATESSVLLTTGVPSFVISGYRNNNYVKSISASVNLLSITTDALFFTPADGYNVNQLHVKSVTINGVEQSVEEFCTESISSGRLRIALNKGNPAYNMDIPIIVTLNDDEENPTWISYGPLIYAYSKQNSTYATTKMLSKTMCRYWQAAKAYHDSL